MERMTYSLRDASRLLGEGYWTLRRRVETTGMVTARVAAIRLPGKRTRWVVPKPALDAELGIRQEA